MLGEFGGLSLGVEGHLWGDKIWGYQSTVSKEDLTRKYERLLQKAWALKDSAGLNAVVYTQITDVETEANGLLTYDRAVIKVDLDRAVAANRGDFSKVPPIRALVPDSREKAQTWRYTTAKPSDDWSKPGFDASGWAVGAGGFGRKDTPGSTVRTDWTSSDIWLRRDVDLPEATDSKNLLLLVHHDDDAEVYINGVLAAKLTGHVGSYIEVPLSPEATAVIHPGKNEVAIHCRQTRGGQYIDLGISEVVPPAK